MKITLKLLLIFSVGTICAFGDSIPNPQLSVESVENISSAFTESSFWEILLYILYTLLAIPIIYIVYLATHSISDKFKTYHFDKPYDVKNLTEYVETLEQFFDKKFPSFKKSIEEYNVESEGDMSEHAEVVNSILLCIKLNGRKRIEVFWDLSDTFLKALILMLPITGISIIIMAQTYYGISGLILSLVSLVIVLPLLIAFLPSFLQFTQFLARKMGKAIPSLSIALLALNALVNRNVIRTLDKKTGLYFYRTIIHKYNNEVNANAGFSGVYVRTSGMLYGNLEKMALNNN